MKRTFVLIAAFASALALSACDNLGTINGLIGGLYYSIQVNNAQAGGGRMAGAVTPATITTGDTVELYIETFEYLQDKENRALILIANGDRDMGSEIISNAGWYSVKADLKILTTAHYDSYSAFFVRITKLRVNGTPYDIPEVGPTGVAIFGRPTSRWNNNPIPAFGHAVYPNNFSGLMVTPKVYSIKTVITVDPDIIKPDGQLADDPYQYIKVEARVNE